jgi:hypothetical protein
VPYFTGWYLELQILKIGHLNKYPIFKTKKKMLLGTLIKTGPIAEAKQIKQCVYNILCACGRCYIGETSKPLEVA